MLIIVIAAISKYISPGLYSSSPFYLGGAGTFFVNCLRICTCERNLLPVYYEKGNCSSNQAALVRMVKEGHLLGDHSSDHMAHNHIGKGYHYWSGPRDLPYFGDNNSQPILSFLKEEAVEEKLLGRVEASMRTVKRMPFTNIWRLPGVNTKSSLRGVRRVAGALAATGGLVFGWDLHWGLTWSFELRREVRHVTGVRGMLMQLKTDQGKLPGKLILLSHDYNHLHPEAADPPLNRKMTSGPEDLAEFIRGAKERGWTLRTLDTYLTD